MCLLLLAYMYVSFLKNYILNSWREGKNISYPCYMKNTPKLSSQKHFLSHGVPEGQETGSGLAGRFWLWVSPEVAVSLTARALVPWRLAGVWGTSFWARPGNCGLEEEPPRTWASQSCSQPGSWSPSEWMIWETDTRTEAVCLLHPNHSGKYHLFCGILLVTLRMTEGIDTRKWGSLEAILEAGCWSCAVLWMRKIVQWIIIIHYYVWMVSKQVKGIGQTIAVLLVFSRSCFHLCHCTPPRAGVSNSGSPGATSPCGGLQRAECNFRTV